MQFEVRGQKNVKRYLKEAQKKILKAAEVGMIQALFLIQSNIRKQIMSPLLDPSHAHLWKQTGLLMGSIQVAINVALLEGKVYSDTIYGPTHEYGDSARNIPPRQFFEPGWQLSKDRAYQIMLGMVQGAVRAL